MTPLETALATVEETPDNWAMCAAIRGLLIGYDARYRVAQQQITLNPMESTEVVRNAPLTNPDTGHNSRTWSTVGIIDKLGMENSQSVIWDHKTTSSDISDPAGPYWRQLSIADQPSHYELLLLQHGERPSRVVWDVVRKPSIKPKQISKKDRERIVEFGEYCGFALSREALKSAPTIERESGEFYQYRVAQSCLDDPMRYFARRDTPRTNEQLAEYASELWEIGQVMRDDRRRGTAFKNASSCFQYNTPCEFLSLCTGEDLPTSDRWQSRQTPDDHPGGKDVLSHSRISCWQTCRRKHFYRYEMGIERVVSQRSDALTFGSAWGQAMDAWWAACNEEKYNGSN